VAGILRSVDTAAIYLPDLTVTFVPRCDGSAWLVDPDTCSVYVDGTTSCDQAADALIDALTALCNTHGVPTPLDTHRQLRLVHNRAVGTA